MRRKAIAASLAAVILAACADSGETPVPAGVDEPAPTGMAAARSTEPAPTMNGFWELVPDTRAAPAALLIPEIDDATLAEIARHDARAERWCHMQGLPFAMDSGYPIEIRIGDGQGIISTSSPLAAVRYVIFGRDHVDPLTFDPSTNGESIGRWDGNVLEIDTIGFSAEKGALSIPGGGFRTESTHLLERISLLDGDTLSVSFSWEDPGVFAAPHNYEYRYRRLPANYEPGPYPPCDYADEQRVSSLEAQWGGPGSLD
jgi:hypothetical protein